MVVVESTIEIDAPVGRVVAVLLDADLAPLWTTGLERLELVEGRVGEAGSVGHAHYVEGGRRFTLIDELEEVDAGRYYRSRVTGGGIEAVVETFLESTDGPTGLRLRWTGRGTSLPARLVLPLLRRRIARGVRADLTSLKAVVEEQR